MILNYTISTLKALRTLPNLNTAQVTLNSRIWPGKRETVKMLKELSPYHDTDIIIHYDFIYIVSRYTMFNNATQKAIISEVADIIKYAEDDKHIKGIVMHTDFPVRRDCYAKGINLQKIADTYTGSLWDAEAVRRAVDNIDILLVNSFHTFYQDLYNELDRHNPRCKVYLENTTKVPQLDVLQGSPTFIAEFLKNSELTNLFGFAYDTEHGYAVEGKILQPLDILELQAQGVPMIVHLNTIPKGVAPCSGKDRHSETTIEECSVFTKEQYEQYADFLNSAKIPWVREVKEDTMFREMKQLGIL